MSSTAPDAQMNNICHGVRLKPKNAKPSTQYSVSRNAKGQRGSLRVGKIHLPAAWVFGASIGSRL